MRKSNCNGSALAWVILVMMLLFFVMICTMALAGGYHAGSVAQNKKRQAAFTVSGLTEALAEDFVRNSREKGGAAGNILRELESQSGTIVETGELEVEGLQEAMGECSVRAVYDKDSRLLKLHVTCERDEQRETETVILENIPTGKIDQGFVGVRAAEWDAFNLVDVLNSRENGSLAFDVWITGDRGTDLAREETGIIHGAGRQKTLYCNGPVFQSSVITGNHAPVLGSIVSGSGIDLSREDNDFAIESGNPYYSLYACAPGKRSSILLSGSVTVDSPENRKRMCADEIVLSGPAQDQSALRPGSEEEKRMVIYSRLEGKQKIDLKNCVTVMNNIYSEGDILVQGNGCRIGSEDSPVEIEGGNIRITGGREDESPVFIYGTMTARDSIVIETSAPVVLSGDLIAGGSVEIQGNVRVEGSVISKNVVLRQDETQGESLWLAGSLFASRGVSLFGTVSQKEGENIYLYGENPEFLMEGSPQVGPVWSNGKVTASPPYTDLKWNDWVAEDQATAENLKAAENRISLSDTVKLPTVLLTVQLPDFEESDISRIKDPVGCSFDEDGMLSLDSGGMEMIYSLADTEETEAGEKDGIEEKKTAGLGERSGGFLVDARSGADSYLLIEEETELSSFYGYAGNGQDPNSYVVLRGGEGSILSVAEKIEGYVFGDGVLRLEDGCKMRGSCDVGRLVTGEKVSFSFCPLNAGVDSLFTPNWRVIRYEE